MKRLLSMSKGVFSMAAKESKSAEILIYDVIGEDWFGGITSQEFVKQLALLGDVEEITVRINSPGGDVFEGVAIYNALKTHPAKINVQIDSLAASVATVIAMAGDTISISDSGMIMVHNASGLCWGEATDMRKMADLLDKIRSGMMLGAYARTGKTADELTAIMDAETWYTAQEAVDAGWVDSITGGTATAPEARMKFDLSAFKNAPKGEKVRVNAENTAQSGVKAATECTCPCPECLDGDCSACSDVGCDCEGCDCPTAGPDASLTETVLLAARLRNENLRLAEF